MRYNGRESFYVLSEGHEEADNNRDVMSLKQKKVFVSTCSK